MINPECILCTFAVGLFPLAYGLYGLIAGRIYLSTTAKEPVKGEEARAYGCLCIVLGLVYFGAIFWAFSVYDR